MKKGIINLLLAVFGAIYLIASLFPLFKSLFNNTMNDNNSVHEEWVEEPMLIEK